MTKLNRTFIPLLRWVRPVYRVYQLAWMALDWVYPPQCGGCEKSYTRWCQGCQSQARWISGPVCECCGGILSNSGVCMNCTASRPSFVALRSCARYEGPIRNAIRRLKYDGDVPLAEILARPMIERLRESGWKVDMVVPVPSSLARRKMRGYNQASLLALPIALGSGVPYRPKALVKVRETRTQVGLTVVERRENVRKAFSGRGDQVAGKTVLVIDDVTTSGATMEACTAALLDQGARQVYGLTLARAVLDNPV